MSDLSQTLKKELLLKSEPLRTLIEEQLAPLIEAERGKAMPLMTSDDL